MNAHGERKSRRIFLLALLGLLLLLAAAALGMAVRGRAGLVANGAGSPGASPEWPIDFYELRCERVAHDILNGTFTPDATGRVRLEGETEELSVGGAAYVTRTGKRTLVLFVAWLAPYGFGGHLYISEPLTQADARKLPDGRYVIDLMGPVGPDPSGARIETVLERKLGPHWHRVSARFGG